ncbi:hypothetical protein ACFOW1_09660 [Parasediminibacterium paludis]|uniref:Uncharacterized protein n=1 Tax=Parasediminibacterium paludis TaxID=908966 RepID=A0ABV8PVT6_9BACT
MKEIQNEFTIILGNSPRPTTMVVSKAFKAHQFLDVPYAKANTLQCVKNHDFLVIQGSTSTGKSSFLNGLKHLFTSKN